MMAQQRPRTVLGNRYDAATPERTVLFAAFGGEEIGMVGSGAWADRHLGERVAAARVADRVPAELVDEVHVRAGARRLELDAAAAAASFRNVDGRQSINAAAAVASIHNQSEYNS